LKNRGENSILSNKPLFTKRNNSFNKDKKFKNFNTPFSPPYSKEEKIHSSPYFHFDHITNKTTEDPNYEYFHCDLLDMRALITITLRVESPQVEWHHHILQKGMYARVKIFNIKSKSK
jgi:hypothetical protein